MGTFVTLKLQTKDKHYFTPAFKILQDVTDSLSSYDTDSTIYKLNTFKKVKADFYAYDALSLAKEYYRVTDGYFDVAIGSITKDLYHFGEDAQVPTQEALSNSRIALSGLSLSREELTIEEGIKIDLGGMGKGYGVDRVAEYLKHHNVSNATIALSGDIRCLGACTIEINNPFSTAPLAVLKSTKEEMAFSTSGNYNRYIGSSKHNHLINPKTKTSQQNFISITLIGRVPNSDLDAYATAVSVMPKERAYTFLASQNLAYIILEQGGREVVSENIELFVNYTKKE